MAVWARALWEDARVQAAWPVAAEVYSRVEADRRRKLAAKKGKRGAAAQPEFPGFTPTPGEFAKRFKSIIEAETVPVSWPAAVPYDKLAKMKKVKEVPSKLRQVRGKLNVPRERFRKHGPKGPYEWAGQDLFEDEAK